MRVWKLVSLVCLAACGSTERTTEPAAMGGSGGSPSGSGGNGSGGDAAGANSAGGDSAGGDSAGGDSSGGHGGNVAGQGGSSGTAGLAGAGGDGGHICASKLAREPVDIIIVVDTSGSMSEEAQAIEDNINLNFASILEENDVDYRVILIARHRQGPRGDSGPDATAICVAAPLGGGVCPSPNPTFGERFFHYNERVDSEDSLDIILAGYASPDDSIPAVNGYAGWLRPGVKKVFVEQSDANPILPVDEFLSELTTLAPEHFGSSPDNLTFVFHSIIGLAEKPQPTDPYLPEEPIVSDLCGAVTNAGEAYQDLSMRTGGLRFPICQFEGFDAIFEHIAADVTVKSTACDFAIPEPPAGEMLDLATVTVRYTAGDGSGAVDFEQVASAVACNGSGFYIDSNRLFLCPLPCLTVQFDQASKVDILFACEGTAP